MISVVSPRGTLHFTVFFGRFNAAVFVEFLTKLMHDAPGPVYLILDNLSVHKAKIVKDYVDSLEGRLKLFFLPGYSPKLNPDEWVWRTSSTTMWARWSRAPETNSRTASRRQSIASSGSRRSSTVSSGIQTSATFTFKRRCPVA